MLLNRDPLRENFKLLFLVVTRFERWCVGIQLRTSTDENLRLPLHHRLRFKKRCVEQQLGGNWL